MAYQGLSMDPNDRDDNQLLGIPDRYRLPVPVTIQHGPMISIDHTYTTNRNTIRGIDRAGMLGEDLSNPRVVQRRVNREYQWSNLMAAVRQAEGALNRQYGRNVFGGTISRYI